MSIYSPIQPDLLSVNQAKPIMGMKVGEVYDALNPWGFPGEFKVMHIQASVTISGAGLALRQEMGIFTSEADQNISSTGTVSNLVMSAHGITGIATDNQWGYFYYVDDAVAGTALVAGVHETGQIASIIDANTFELSNTVSTAKTTADDFNIFKPGRMKVAANDSLLPSWGVSARSLTDEYYGFMIVKGWAMIQVAGNGTAVVLADFVIPGTSGIGKGGTAGTNDIAAYAQSTVSTSAATQYVPAFVKGYPA